MTRFVSFPLALVTALSLSLTACGGDDTDDAAAPLEHSARRHRHRA